MTSGVVVELPPLVTGVPENLIAGVGTAELALKLTASDVETVVPLSVTLELDGATPAPPPIINALAVNAAEDDSCVVELK